MDVPVKAHEPFNSTAHMRIQGDGGEASAERAAAAVAAAACRSC